VTWAARPQVCEDLVASGDRVVARPRLELVAKRVQKGIGADSGIPEQVPRAADRVACLQDREGLVRHLRRHVIGGPNAGDPSTDDQHVDVVGGDGCVGLRGGCGHEHDLLENDDASAMIRTGAPQGQVTTVNASVGRWAQPTMPARIGSHQRELGCRRRWRSRNSSTGGPGPCCGDVRYGAVTAHEPELV
jgi:hypothetical protein